jgi:hypothetical protein
MAAAFVMQGGTHDNTSQLKVKRKRKMRVPFTAIPFPFSHDLARSLLYELKSYKE